MSLTKLPDWAQHFLTQLSPKMKFIRVAGAAANTNIAISGITTSDIPIVAYNETDDAHVLTTAVKASVTGATAFGTTTHNFDSVLEAHTAGAAGNEWSVALRSGHATGVAVTVDVAKQRVDIQFKAGTSTVGNVETAIAALADANDVVDVKTAGTSATVLLATDIGVSKLTGGKSAVAELPKATSAGNIRFATAVTTGKNLIIGYVVRPVATMVTSDTGSGTR